MITLEKDNLLKYLSGRHLDAKYFDTTKQIAIVLKEDGKDFPLFLQVDVTGKILQLLSVMPCTMRPKAPPEMARLLHLLNKEIDLPGFGMDEAAGIVFYRTVLITGNGKIDKTILDHIFDSLPNIYKVFFNPIASVANGVYFEAIQNDVKTYLQSISANLKEQAK